MAPFFGDRGSRKTRVVMVCGRCEISEAHADGQLRGRQSEHCGATAGRLWLNRLKSEAAKLADVCQCSRVYVEGLNGYLSLRNHAL